MVSICNAHLVPHESPTRGNQANQVPLASKHARDQLPGYCSVIMPSIGLSKYSHISYAPKYPLSITFKTYFLFHIPKNDGIEM